VCVCVCVCVCVSVCVSITKVIVTGSWVMSRWKSFRPRVWRRCTKSRRSYENMCVRRVNVVCPPQCFIFQRHGSTLHNIFQFKAVPSPRAPANTPRICCSTHTTVRFRAYSHSDTAFYYVSLNVSSCTLRRTPPGSHREEPTGAHSASSSEVLVLASLPLEIRETLWCWVFEGC
jgi:hypothetical protein